MEKLKWLYIEPLENKNAISDFEKKYEIKIPNDLRNCILLNNGGRPNLEAFDTNKTKERVFKTLLSFNTDDLETIYQVMPIFEETKLLLPFASDPSGNFICINLQNNEVVLWLHETNNQELIANSFDEFLSKLYD